MANQVRSGDWMCGFTITSTDTVVDIGCYDGNACVFAGNLGATVIGVDIDAEAIGRAIGRMKQTRARSFQGIVSECNPIPLPDGTATAVICTEMLEHVDDPKRCAAELARIGKPGCRYLITVPDGVSEGLMKVVAPHWYFQKPIHQRVYQRADLRKLIEEAGLEVTEHKTKDFYGAMWWIFRMAVGMQTPCDPVPQAPLLALWEQTYQALLATPNGPALAQALDNTIPKSQVVFACKPAKTNGTLRRPHHSQAPLGQTRAVGSAT
jgi:2-polyprenyl-3-methyl-5-hydroxy-6-metoxy-1,4-benzoquinol methylase